jgi:succinate dehydrogenase / fumarate reductase, cytochrome b subunit
MRSTPRQREYERARWDMLHVPQLVGLALGLQATQVGLQRHIARPTSLIDWSQAVIAGPATA